MVEADCEGYLAPGHRNGQVLYRNVAHGTNTYYSIPDFLLCHGCIAHAEKGIRVRYIVASIIALVISAAHWDAQALPRWSFGIKGGYFYPDIEGWEDQYDKDGAYVGGIEIGFKFLVQ